MNKERGIIIFKKLRWKAYSKIYDSVVAGIKATDRNGYKFLNITRFSPLVLKDIEQQLQANGYDALYIEENNVPILNIHWG